MQRIGTVVLMGDQAASNTPTPPPEIIIDDVSIAEQSSSHIINVPVRLATASNTPVTVRFDTVELDQSDAAHATAGTDFVAVTGQVVNIPAGTTSVDVPVTILGDVSLELDQTFECRLTLLDGPVGSAIIKDTGTITIENDDGILTAYPNITLGTTGGSSVIENASGASITFRVDFGTVVNVECSVDFSFHPSSTAIAGVDFTDVSGTYSIQPGQQFIQIDVPVLNDVLVEGDETIIGFINNLVAPPGSAITGSTFTGTITDNDNFIDLNINAISGTFGEGDTGSQIRDMFVVTFATIPAGEPLQGQMTFRFRTTNLGTATPGTDFSEVTGLLMGTNIATNRTAVGALYQWEIPIETFGNFDLGADRTIVGEIYDIQTVDPRGRINTAQATQTIVNDDDPYTASVTALSTAYSENTNMQFRIQSQQALGTGTSATFDVETFVKGVADEATPGVDYVVSNDTLSISAGASVSNVLNVPILRDYIDEPGNRESVFVRITGFSSTDPRLQLGIAEASSEIIDIDDPETVNVTGSGNALEDSTTTSTTLRWLISTSAPLAPGTSATVQYRTILSSGPSPATPNVDYTPISGQVTLTPTVQSQTIEINPTDDLNVEDTETVTLEIHDLVTDDQRMSMGNTVADAAIIDDDFYIDYEYYSVTQSVNPESASNLLFGFRNISGVAPNATVTIGYSTFVPTDPVPVGSDAWATPGSDYTATTGTLDFLTTTNPATILYAAVPVIDDTDFGEGVEAVALRVDSISSTDPRVRLSPATPAGFYRTATITDDDVEPVILSWPAEYDTIGLSQVFPFSPFVYRNADVNASGGIGGSNYVFDWSVSPASFVNEVETASQYTISPLSSAVRRDATVTLTVTSGASQGQLTSNVILWPAGGSIGSVPGAVFTPASWATGLVDFTIQFIAELPANYVWQSFRYRSAFGSTPAGIPRDVVVETSNNGSTWNPFFSTTGLPRNNLYNSAQHTVNMAINQISGSRYIRLTFSRSWSGSGTVRVRDLEVFAAPET